MNYFEAKAYLKEHKNIKSSLDFSVENIISNKNNKFTIEQANTEYRELITNNILVTKDSLDYYYLNFKSPLACTAIIDYVSPYPSKPFLGNPYTAIDFIEKFLENLRRPKINFHWYGFEFRRDLAKFILLEFEQYFVYNFEELLGICRSNHGLESPNFRLKSYLPYIIPEYRFSSEQFYKLACIFHSQEDERNNSIEIIGRVVSKSEESALGLFSIAKLKEKEAILFLPTILKGLSKFDFQKAYSESLILLNDVSTQPQGLWCIGVLQYKNITQLVAAFERIKNLKTEDIQSLQKILPIYKRLLENTFSTEKLKKDILKEIEDFISKSPEEVLRDVVLWITFIDGYEKERLDFLIILINRGVDIEFSSYFQNFNTPKYLFDFVKKWYAVYGIAAKMNKLDRIFSKFARENTKEFEKGILNLLSNNYGIFRKAGTDLLISRQWNSNSINLLKLSEKRQLIVLDTILAIPFSIEKTVPIILQLRNSKFQSVKNTLTQYCLKLLYAYEELVLKILRNHLNLEIPLDNDLYYTIEQSWREYEKVLEHRQSIIELNPFINQRSYVELFYRLEKEYQTEQMEQVHNNSELSLLRFVKNIKVIRGSAFKVDTQNSKITRLGTISAKTYLDKRYFINPDAYEKAYMKHVLYKNYKGIDDEDNNS